MQEQILKCEDHSGRNTKLYQTEFTDKDTLPEILYSVFQTDELERPNNLFGVLAVTRIQRWPTPNEVEKSKPL